MLVLVLVLVRGRCAVLLPVGMWHLGRMLVSWRTGRVLMSVLGFMSGGGRGGHGQRAHHLPKEHIEEDHQ